jgi:hypothetical protein
MAISVIGAALDMLNGCPDQGFVVADEVVFVLVGVEKKRLRKRTYSRQHSQ